METLEGLEAGQVGGNEVGAGQAAAGGQVGVQVGYQAGKAFEGKILGILQRFAAQHGGDIFKQVMVKGPGGKRFIDFVFKVGDRLIGIEAKTKIPLYGRVLARFAGQLKTFLNPTSVGSSTTVVAGEMTEVIVVTEEELAAAEVAWARIAAKLETGAMGPVLSGTTELEGLLAKMLGL